MSFVHLDGFSWFYWRYFKNGAREGQKISQTYSELVDKLGLDLDVGKEDFFIAGSDGEPLSYKQIKKKGNKLGIKANSVMLNIMIDSFLDQTKFGLILYNYCNNKGTRDTILKQLIKDGYIPNIHVKYKKLLDLPPVELVQVYIGADRKESARYISDNKVIMKHIEEIFNDILERKYE